MSGIRRGAAALPEKPLVRAARNARHREPGRPVLMLVASGAGLAAVAMAVLVGFSGLFV